MVSTPGLNLLRRPATSIDAAHSRRLVLVHGAMDRATSFTRLMANLPEWDIVSYDRRGYGASIGTGPPVEFRQQIEDLASVMDSQPAVVFGHSIGADVVLATAEVHPALFPAILVWEPPQPWLPWWPRDTVSAGLNADMDPAERAEWFMRRMVGDRIWERLPSATRAQRRAEGPTLAADMAALGNGPLWDPDKLWMPITVGRGPRSSPHQRRGARELAASLRRGELAEIDDSGHGVHLSHPRELAELIRRAAQRALGTIWP